MKQQHTQQQARSTTGFFRTTSSGGSRPASGAAARPGGRRQDDAPSMPPLSNDTLFVPPGSMFLLGGIGIFVGICANLWQMYTSFSAFQHLFVGGPIYKGMSASGQSAALPIITIVCALVSVAFQLAILYLVFRIDRSWKDTKAHATTGKGSDAARHTAVELMHHVPLLLLWGILGFIADTVGDYTFIALYSDDWFIQFMYGAALYASSTVMLVGAIEFIWAGMISYEKFKAWRSAMEVAMHRRGNAAREEDA